MMPEFPPPKPMSAWAIAAHVAMLLLAILCITGLVIRGRKPASKRALWLYGIVILIAPIVLVLLVDNDTRAAAAPIFHGFLVFAWLIAGIGFLIELERIPAGQSGTWALLVVGLLFVLEMFFVCLMPSTPRAGEAARRSRCTNNLKNLGLALHNHHDEHGRFPRTHGSEEQGPPVSWRVILLPYLDDGPLRSKYNTRADWDHESNLPIARTDTHDFRCPSNFFPQDNHQRYFTAYAAVLGPQTVFPDGAGLSLDEITDGTAQTLLLVEACGANIVWTRPADLQLSDRTVGINLPGRTQRDSEGISSSYHPGGTNVLFADGAARYLSQEIDPTVLKALLTATGGETLPPDGF